MQFLSEPAQTFIRICIYIKTFDKRWRIPFSQFLTKYHVHSFGQILKQLKNSKNPTTVIVKYIDNNLCMASCVYYVL